MAKFCVSLLIFNLISFTLLYAQPGDPGEDPDNPIPMTGVEYLLIAGGILGASRLIKRNNSKN